MPCVPGDRSLIAPWGPTQALTHTEPPLPLRHVSAVKGCPTEEATGSLTVIRYAPLKREVQGKREKHSCIFIPFLIEFKMEPETFG